MAAEQPTRDAFIAAIEAKIAAWTAVLNSYRAAVSLDGSLGDRTGAHQHPHHAHHEPAKAMDLPVGVFRDKSIKEAIEIYLAAGRRKQTNKEIAAGVQKGGIATTSTNFEATIATALGRMKEEGTVLRFPDGWDLASSYPESLRSRLENNTKPKRTRKAAKKAASAKKAEPAKQAAESPREDKTKQILALITGDSEGKTVGDVVAWFEASGAQVSPDYVRVVSRRLRERGKIDLRDGKFYPVAAA